MEPNIDQYPILIFDGVCHLCNRSVQFVLKRNSQKNIFFASLQSEIGKSLFEQYQIDAEKIDSLVVIHNKKVFIESDAVFYLCQFLDSLWPLLRIFRWIPKWVRNSVYRWVATNRYRFFGKGEQCMFLNSDEKQQFL
ncbi:MAG: putative DCC family thiol-disulfide oxidoreductase YuxK [bacterium]|jgi:predicted DCC family thiol-disulfide oxidoreductase YuxK